MSEPKGLSVHVLSIHHIFSSKKMIIQRVKYIRVTNHELVFSSFHKREVIAGKWRP